jgi:tRNA-dihydrouridine synthase
MCIEEKGEYTGIREMRKHIGWYTQGMKGSAGLRRSINEAESADAMTRLIEGLKEQER